MHRLEIREIPFTTPKGVVLEGTEKVVYCPMWICQVNVKKNCGKCLNKQKLSLKDGYVDCKYDKQGMI